MEIKAKEKESSSKIKKAPVSGTRFYFLPKLGDSSAKSAVKKTDKMVDAISPSPPTEGNGDEEWPSRYGEAFIFKKLSGLFYPINEQFKDLSTTLMEVKNKAKGASELVAAASESVHSLQSEHSS